MTTREMKMLDLDERLETAINTLKFHRDRIQTYSQLEEGYRKAGDKKSAQRCRAEADEAARKVIELTQACADLMQECRGFIEGAEGHD